MPAKASTPRHDVSLWFSGMVFCALLIGSIFYLGELRGWDAVSGFTHNTSLTSRDRFLPEPFVPEPGVPGRHGADSSSRWYYWKLPPDRVTALSRTVIWSCYAAHNLFAWFVIYRAQKAAPQYSSALNRWNVIGFAGHVFFHVLHLAQTHWTYDALAQDVSIASSQSSVVMLLLFVMVMEYPERGLALGLPSAASRKTNPAIQLIRRFHGYAFAWAATYTFWYHPMENTLGHAFGFCHTWFLLLQASLIYTPLHKNRYWRLLLEVWVCLHGTAVAIQTGGPALLGTTMWPMFFHGFMAVFVLTQVFSIPFWSRLPRPLQLLPLALFVIVVLYNYSWIPDGQGRTWIRITETLRIPSIYYLFVWYAQFVVGLFPRVQSGKVAGSAQRAILGAAILMIFAVFVAVSIYIQMADVQLHVVLAMVILVSFFELGCAAQMVMLDAVLPSVSVKKAA